MVWHDRLPFFFFFKPIWQKSTRLLWELYWPFQQPINQRQHSQGTTLLRCSTKRLWLWVGGVGTKLYHSSSDWLMLKSLLNNDYQPQAPQIIHWVKEDSVKQTGVSQHRFFSWWGLRGEGWAEVWRWEGGKNWIWLNKQKEVQLGFSWSLKYLPSSNCGLLPALALLLSLHCQVSSECYHHENCLLAPLSPSLQIPTI